MNNEIATYTLWKNYVTGNYKLTCIRLSKLSLRYGQNSKKCVAEIAKKKKKLVHVLKQNMWPWTRYVVFSTNVVSVSRLSKNIHIAISNTDKTKQYSVSA